MGLLCECSKFKTRGMPEADNLKLDKCETVQWRFRTRKFFKHVMPIMALV